jgi:hypothetical protein
VTPVSVPGTKTMVTQLQLSGEIGLKSLLGIHHLEFQILEKYNVSETGSVSVLR